MQLPPDNSLSHHMQHKTKNVKVDSKNHTPKNYLFQNFSFHTRSKISAQEHVIGRKVLSFGNRWSIFVYRELPSGELEFSLKFN
jgi:hypothetical protein